MLLYASTRLCYVMSGISYEHVTQKLDTRSMFVYHTFCISLEKVFLGLFHSISAYVSILDIFVICQHTLAKTLWCDRALR